MGNASQPKPGTFQDRVLRQLRDGEKHRDEMAKNLGLRVDQVMNALGSLRDRGWDITRVGRIYGLGEFTVDTPQQLPKQPQRILRALQDGPRGIAELAAITGDDQRYARHLLRTMLERNQVKQDGDVFRIAS